MRLPRARRRRRGPAATATDDLDALAPAVLAARDQCVTLLSCQAGVCREILTYCPGRPAG